MSGLGTILADDKFNYGVADGGPLSVEESGFLENILKVYFLPSINNDPLEEYEFKYHRNGFIVEIHGLKNKNFSVMINLWTATVVKEGLCLVMNNIFINSPEFRSFFRPEDRSLVSNGTAVEAAGKSIYVIPDFKGSSYLMTSTKITKTRIITKIYRKWNEAWYTWIHSDNLRGISDLVNLNYKWINRDSKIYRRQDSFGNNEGPFCTILSGCNKY